jgi:hypothetical protein
MQYAGMSEDINGEAGATGSSASGKYGGLLSASHSLSDLQHIQEEDEEGDQEDDDSADGATATDKRRARSPAPPPPPPPAHGQLSKSASAIKSSLSAGTETTKPSKRNFSYFDGMWVCALYYGLPSVSYMCSYCVGEGCMNGISKGDVWKVQLGKYLKYGPSTS